MKHIYIFGAGISGATMARLFASKGFGVTVYEEKKSVSGNCFDFKNSFGVLTHKYGPHIFHSNNNKVIKFVKKFSSFNNWQPNNLVSVKNKLIPLPFNFASLETLFPKESNKLKKLLKSEFKKQATVSVFQLYESKNQDIRELGKFIYKNIYENYSSKMWGVPVCKIDKDVLNRVLITIGYCSSYFPNDKFQGLPNGGYTKLVKNILNHKKIEVVLDSKQTLTIKKDKTYINNRLITDPIFYCGEIDKLFNYKHNPLPYRSLKIKFVDHSKDSFQSTAVINYPSHPKYTRIVEYKKMTLQNIKNKTTISYEFPCDYDKNISGSHPFYPISSLKSKTIYNKYSLDVKKITNLHMLGRLAEYKYYDMDDAIANAMSVFKALIKK